MLVPCVIECYLVLNGIKWHTISCTGWYYIALYDVNVFRYADYLKKFTEHTQFLVITHRKGTMEAADSVYGVTMEESGISKLLSMKLKQ